MSKNYICNTCEKDTYFDTPLEMARHYRKKHPDDAYGLWDAIGTTGDAFADNLVKHYKVKFHDIEGKARQKPDYQEAYQDLVVKSQKLADKLEIIRLAVK